MFTFVAMQIKGNIKHIFFDLDRTLWDFDANVLKTLTDLYYNNSLDTRIPSPTEFIERYTFENNRYWELYIKGAIKKEHLRVVRFSKTLEFFGIKNEAMALGMANDYINLSPLQEGVMPHTHQTLRYLSLKYTLHIITNGFDEVQHIKAQAAGLTPYFQHIVTSDKAKALKPDRAIFDYSLALAQTTPAESLMVGDDIEKDYYGGIYAGMQSILYQPTGDYGLDVFHITDLRELTKLL